MDNPNDPDGLDQEPNPDQEEFDREMLHKTPEEEDAMLQALMREAERANPKLAAIAAARRTQS